MNYPHYKKVGDGLQGNSTATNTTTPQPQFRNLLDDTDLNTAFNISEFKAFMLMLESKITPMLNVSTGTSIIGTEATKEGENKPDFEAKFENMINVADSMANNFRNLAKEYWELKKKNSAIQQENKTLRQQLENQNSNEDNDPTG
jgi:hypothetical protein